MTCLLLDGYPTVQEKVTKIEIIFVLEDTVITFAVSG
jgi:hypothetical protein